MAAQAEKDYMAAVAAQGCICCRKLGLGATPAQVHHKREGVGKGQRASHFDTLPLCPLHHLHGEDAVHKNYTLFVQHYGSEDELVKQTRRDVQVWRDSFVGG